MPIGEVDGKPSLPPGVDPVSANADTILLAIQSLRQDLGSDVKKLSDAFEDHKRQTDSRVRLVELRVDGSLPPGPLAPGAEPLVPVSKRLEKIEATLAAQSSAMGIGVQGIEWLFSKDGRKGIVRLMTLAGAAYAALHAAGAVPSPGSVPPAPAPVVVDAGAVVH